MGASMDEALLIGTWGYKKKLGIRGREEQMQIEGYKLYVTGKQ